MREEENVYVHEHISVRVFVHASLRVCERERKRGWMTHRGLGVSFKERMLTSNTGGTRPEY